MKHLKFQLLKTFGLFGIHPLETRDFFRGWSFYRKDYRTLRKQLNGAKEFPFGNAYPILGDKFDKSGVASGDYFHQDLLVARRVFETNPEKHIDIGSRVDGFVAHVAVFRKIEVFDIRPQQSLVKNIEFVQADLTRIPDHLKSYADSISSLHAIEHFGLGRYGDEIDAWGHLKAFENIYQILRRGGKFYYSGPIGPQRIEFNAHRVFNVGYLLGIFEGKYKVDRFSYVDDRGVLHENVELTAGEAANSFGCNYGCGIFELVKL